jgi:hypothetical protein
MLNIVYFGGTVYIDVVDSMRESVCGMDGEQQLKGG